MSTIPALVYASLRPDHEDPPPVFDPRNGSFRLLTDIEVEEMVPPEDLIDGLFSEQALVLLYSYPGKGKTFIVLDWGLCLATGEPWFGRTVNKPGSVIYIAAEGASALGPRLRAWKHDRGYWGRRTLLQVHDAPVDLLTGNVGELAKAVRRDGTRLVIFDTLAASMVGGDENSAKDMGAAIANLNVIRKAGATVIVVHHTGKNDQSERGSLALRGAADTVIKLKANGSGLSLVCEKQRDSDRFKDIAVALRVVHPAIGKSSCVVDQSTVSLMGAASDLSPWIPPMLRIVAANIDITNQRFRELSGFKKGTFDRYLRHLTSGSLVESARRGRNTLYRLTALGSAALVTHGQDTPRD